MSELTVSTKYQVVIPKEVRNQLHLHSGQKVVCISKGGVIHLIPVKPIGALKGFAKGISIAGLRDKTDRF